jgi:deoxyribonuclease-4
MTNPFSFGTVGSPTSTPKKPGGSIGAVEQIHCLDLDALELGWVQSVRVNESTCLSIQQAAKKNQVHLSVHAPYFINLNGDEEEWPKSRKRLMDAAFYGNLAGATDIIFHPGSYFTKSPEDVLPIAINRLAQCVKDLKEQGNHVILRPETMGKTAMLGSLVDTLKMSQEIDGVLPCLDFAHLHARPGDGSINSESEFQEILDIYRYYLGTDSLQRLHIHLSGIAYGLKGEKSHLPLRESDFNLTDLFSTLYKSNCAGRILCESPILEEDAIYMKGLWKSMTPRDIL